MMAPSYFQEAAVETGLLQDAADAQADEVSAAELTERGALAQERRTTRKCALGGAIGVLGAVAILAYFRAMPGALSQVPADLKPVSKLDAALPASWGDRLSPRESVKNARRKPKASIKPSESMHDGNTCDDNEELHAGLCYTKCSLLTSGSYPQRSTAFSCCATDNCAMNIFNLKTASLIPCHGFDTSIADHGAACPHVPGACLVDEEQYSGLCYEKCSVLTTGKYPNRVGPATCCGSIQLRVGTHGAACLDPFNDKTQLAFAVGGGKGDHDPSTPSTPHAPLQALTEAK